jgi:hypothetical protein
MTSRTAAATAAAPLRTLLLLASFALTAYAGVRLVEHSQVLGLVLWLVGAALLHDLVLLPLYGLADRALQRALRRRSSAVRRNRADAPSPLVNHVRVPVFVSGVLLLTWYPLILGRAQRYEPYTTLDPGVFWGRWLLLTAALFAASALAYAARALLGRRPGHDGGGERDEGGGPASAPG